MCGGGRGEGLYLTLHCPHQKDSCTKVGSGVSHVNLSFAAEKQKSLSLSVIHNFNTKHSQRGIEPSA